MVFYGCQFQGCTSLLGGSLLNSTTVLLDTLRWNLNMCKLLLALHHTLNWKLHTHRHLVIYQIQPTYWQCVVYKGTYQFSRTLHKIINTSQTSFYMNYTSYNFNHLFYTDTCNINLWVSISAFFLTLVIEKTLISHPPAYKGRLTPKLLQYGVPFVPKW